MNKMRLFDIIGKLLRTWKVLLYTHSKMQLWRQSVTTLMIFLLRKCKIFYPPPRIMFKSCSRASSRRQRHSACHSPPNHMLTSQLNVKQYKLWLGLSVLLFVQTLSISHSSLILKEKSLPCWLNKLQTSLQPTELLFLFYCFFLLLSPSFSNSMPISSRSMLNEFKGIFRRYSGVWQPVASHFAYQNSAVFYSPPRKWTSIVW